LHGTCRSLTQLHYQLLLLCILLAQLLQFRVQCLLFCLQLIAATLCSGQQSLLFSYLLLMQRALLGNLYARWLRQPAAIVRTPGLLLLVPGSLGFSGFTTAISGDFGSSGPFVFRMLLVGGSIVAGLLFAGVVLPPPLEVEPGSRRD